MTVDDEDLERAGTRSRRQLSNSKQYSVYPPPEEQDRYPHHVKKSFATAATTTTNPFNNRKSRSFILISITAIVLFILYLSKTSLSRVKLTTTKASSFDLNQDSTNYKDSTQLTDYALLSRLLLEKKGSTSSDRLNFDSLDATIAPGQNSFAHQLAKGLVMGHTFDELRRLTNNIPLPTTTNNNKQHRRVPVTAIIHTTTVTQLYIQVQSVLTQTSLPEHIWIICDTNQKAEVEARIMTLDRRRVKVMGKDNSNTTQHEWLQTMSHVSTEFVWIIDQDIAPGKRYLENLLKLSLTKQYKSALLGTEAASLSLNTAAETEAEEEEEEFKTRIECVPDTMHSSSRQMKSQVVDMVNDNWLLHRSWISYILDAIEKEKISSITTPNSLEAFTGLFISRILYINAGIPSIAIPTDPIERAYWGDVRLQKTQKSETCKALGSLVEDQNMKLSAVHEDLFYRNNEVRTAALGALNSTATKEPVLVYVDSVVNLESLAELLCQFELKQEPDLHIVTGGYLNDQQVKSSLLNLCKKESLDIVIHDISMLHESSNNWNSVNNLLHRLTRIMTAIQPKILIHSVDKENSLYSSIKAASEIVGVTSIYLPTQDIPHALWMTELSIDTISKWNSFSIKVMINTDKKPHALVRSLNSATNAHYLGDEIDLTILMDQTTDGVTQTLANNFDWKLGKKNVRHRIAQANKSPIFVESWYPATNDEYAIILNNDLELSRFYYTWAKYAILKYRYSNSSSNKELFGISLYAPPLIETDPQGRHLFNPSQILSKEAVVGRSENDPYVMQWPSYSGAVFFPEHWREFHDYITARLADNSGFELQDVVVPDLRSNEWTRSWRKYFEELVYLRSYVMLYPNFNGGSSLSTRYLELRKKTMREEFADAISIYKVPLMDQQDQISALKLPEFKDLPVFDIWGNLSNLDELKERGSELHDEISACPAPLEEEKEYHFDATDLLCPFARIVSVTLENEHDPLPELPTREVTVYN